MSERIVFLKHQARAFLSNKKIIALIGGTGGGKTWFAVRYAFLKSYEKYQKTGEKVNVILSAPDYKMLKRLLFKGLEEFLKKNKIKYTKNSTDMEIITSFANFYFISATNPDKMQGVHADLVIGDEAGLYSIDWWYTATQRIALKQGKILLTTTPYGENWLKTEVYDRALNGDENIELITFTSFDNPYFDKRELEILRETLPAWRYRMLVLGHFTKPENLIYSNYETAIIKTNGIPREFDVVIRGVDLGFNNPTAVVYLGKKDNIWYVYDEIKQSQLTIDKLIEILKKEKDMITYIDPSDKQIVETLKKQGLRVYAGDNDVLLGIQFIQNLFEKQKLKVSEECKKLIDELATYSWELDRKGNLKDTPKKENDHLVDALRYALFTYEAKKPTPRLSFL